MFKKGFTLAEVLVTLGIVGVIAALTLPTLIADTQTAQIGPKLAKAVSAFEQANARMLDENSVDSLSDAALLSTSSSVAYANELQKYLKLSQNGTDYLSKDGVMYSFTITKASPETTGTPVYQQRIGDVTIDINGNLDPNVNGTDKFYFSWWNDGSLRPYGGTNWNGGADPDYKVDEDGKYILDNGKKIPTGVLSDAPKGTKHWATACAANAVPSDAKYCAGHIFENNLKVLYK